MQIVDGARSPGYRALARRRLEEVRTSLPALVKIEPTARCAALVCVALHETLAKRMSAESLAQAVSGMRTAAEVVDEELGSVLRHPLVANFVTALRRRAGPPRLGRGAVPLSPADYARLRDAERLPMEIRQAAALLWVRAARFADVKAMRAGSLWLMPSGLWAMELAGEKTSAVGTATRAEIDVPIQERRLLRDLVSDSPPTTAMMDRPPLLPGLRRKRFITALRRVAGPGYTTHSFRKGSVSAMLDGGCSEGTARLLTGHRTSRGFQPYSSRADAPTEARLREVGRILTVSSAGDEESEASASSR